MIALRRKRFIPWSLCLLSAPAFLVTGTSSGTVPQGSPPGRPATEDEIREFHEKLTSLSEFRAVYELKSKKNTGRLILSYREPHDGLLCVQVTAADGSETQKVECWLADGCLISKFTGDGESKYLRTGMVEPMERVELLRVTLDRDVRGLRDERVAEVTARFQLHFASDPDDPERVRANSQLYYVCDEKPVRVKWFDRKESWSGARRVGDRIEVELDDCQYGFSADTGLLVDARIGEAGTVRLVEFRTEVEAQELAPSKPDSSSDDSSAEAERSAWRDMSSLARWHAFSCLAKQDGVDESSDARFDTWRRVMTDFYEDWLPRYFASALSNGNERIDGFLKWHAEAMEAAGGDATALETLAGQTKEWVDRFKAGLQKNLDLQVTALEVPEKTEISNALGSRGLEAEREIFRVVLLERVVEPLLQRLTEGTKATDEHK